MWYVYKQNSCLGFGETNLGLGLGDNLVNIWVDELCHLKPVWGTSI